MAQNVAIATRKIINALYNYGNWDKAALSNLRSASSIDSPRAMSVLPTFMMYMGEDMLSKNGKPTFAETAIYASVRLFAIHQQSKDKLVFGPSGADSDSGGLSYFEILRELRKNPETRDRLDKRVQPILSSTSFPSIVNSLNQLTGMIRSSGLTTPVDYAQLAQDLFRFQLSFESANNVRFRWGQAYYRFFPENNVAKTEGETKND